MFGYGVGQVLSFFIFLWLLIYAIVCFNFISKKNSDTKKTIVSNNKLKLNHASVNSIHSKIAHQNPNVSTFQYTNPFVSASCNLIYGENHDSTHVFVVIPVRNEARANLFQSVFSVAKNSPSSVLTDILIVDDFSDTTVSIWSEWKDKQLSKMLSVVQKPSNVGQKSSKPNLSFLRLYKREGVAVAKAKGAEVAFQKLGDKGIVIFVDSHVYVSNNWLEPLLETLKNHPKSLVYPGIDVIDGDTEEVIEGDNVVVGCYFV